MPRAARAATLLAVALFALAVPRARAGCEPGDKALTDAECRTRCGADAYDYELNVGSCSGVGKQCSNPILKSTCCSTGRLNSCSTGSEDCYCAIHGLKGAGIGVIIATLAFALLALLCLCCVCCVLCKKRRRITGAVKSAIAGRSRPAEDETHVDVVSDTAKPPPPPPPAEYATVEAAGRPPPPPPPQHHLPPTAEYAVMAAPGGPVYEAPAVAGR
jgi:hypothetical protein